MGALVSPLIGLPDADAAGRVKYARVYLQLADLGLSVPADPPETVAKAALEAVLQGHLGARLKDEIDTDPTGQGYSGMTDLQIRNLLLGRPSKQAMKLDGSANMYEVTGGATLLGMQAAIVPGLANPTFNNLIPGIPAEKRVICRFKNNTTTVALQGEFQLVFMAPNNTTLNLAAPLPDTPAIGDRFELFDPEKARRDPPRWAAVSRTIPYANNDLSEADVTAAQV